MRVYRYVQSSVQQIKNKRARNVCACRTKVKNNFVDKTLFSDSCVFYSFALKFSLPINLTILCCARNLNVCEYIHQIKNNVKVIKKAEDKF